MNLFYCLCGDLLEVSSPAKGSNAVELASGNNGDGITSLCDGDVTGSCRIGKIGCGSSGTGLCWQIVEDGQ